MMLMTGGVYLVILWLQKYAFDKHEEKCHKKELEPFLDREAKTREGAEQTDD